MGRVTTRRRVRTIDGQHRQGRDWIDNLTVEEPLEVRVNGVFLAVTMRTPGHDVELAHGLLAAEGVISKPSDVVTARYCSGRVLDSGTDEHTNTYNVLDVELAPHVALPTSLSQGRGSVLTRGECGTPSVQLATHSLPFDLREDAVRVSSDLILSLPDKLRDQQRTFASTGSLHGIGLFTTDAECLVIREDVGRHNATDKVVGWALMNSYRPARQLIMMVSGRTSFDLVHKVVLAGIPILAGVSAPSSLAVDLALECGLTLCGFVRGDRMNIYAGQDRIE